MCIRDSYNAHALSGRVFIAGADLPITFRINAPTRQKHRHCLLYTSDAADERSSVDLGGRRIIKKKKILDNWCRAVNTI